MSKKQYGERLRIARQRKNMRQIDLSTALEEYNIEINQSAIGKIERGQRNLNVQELAAIAEILEVSVEWIVKGGELKIS